MAASTPNPVYVLLLSIVIGIIIGTNNVGATWCVARSNAGPNLLQIELDYACGNGADCGPIQPGGSCFNPNTIYNHASYAFDSFYQRRGRAPGSCNFGGTATIAVTDPTDAAATTAVMRFRRLPKSTRRNSDFGFGACRYPSSLSNVGGANTSTTMSPMNNSSLLSSNLDMNGLPLTESERSMRRGVRKIDQTP